MEPLVYLRARSEKRQQVQLKPAEGAGVRVAGAFCNLDVGWR